MPPDLDDLLLALYVFVDDSLPKRRGVGAPPRTSDAEIICLAVAQALLDCPCDRRFLAVAAYRLAHLFPQRPKQPGYHKRVRRLAGRICTALERVALDAPSSAGQLRLLDSTPIPCMPMKVASPANAPTMSTSPCENLITSSTPKNSVNPTATMA